MTKKYTKKTKDQPDIYQKITDKVITLLEEVNTDDYEAPFAGLSAQGIPINPFTKKQYNGINIPCLWFYQQEHNFSSNRWATFKQWKDYGAQVRKGEQGSQIIFYKTLLKTEENEQEKYAFEDLSPRNVNDVITHATRHMDHIADMINKLDEHIAEVEQARGTDIVSEKNCLRTVLRTTTTPHRI